MRDEGHQQLESPFSGVSAVPEQVVDLNNLDVAQLNDPNFVEQVSACIFDGSSKGIQTLSLLYSTQQMIIGPIAIIINALELRLDLHIKGASLNHGV